MNDDLHSTPHPAHDYPTTGDLFRAVLPADVAVTSWDELQAQGITEEMAIAALWDAEAELAQSYSPKRRTEFATVRACARAAMLERGFAPAPIIKGSRGMPLFPPHAVGALTHTEGLRAAVIARDSAVRAVGVDAEPHGPLPPGVSRTIALPAEHAWLDAVATEVPDLHLDRVLFSAKEATYKAWFPLTRRWLGFEDAEITIQLEQQSDTAAHGTFQSRILIDPSVNDGGTPLQQLHGNWTIQRGFVVAATTVLAAAHVSTPKQGE